MEPIETSNSGVNHAGLYAQNDRWGQGLIEIRYSDTKLAVLHEKNHRWGLEPIETSDFGVNHADLHAQSDSWGLVHTETCNSAPKVTVLCAKTTDECWDP